MKRKFSFLESNREKSQTEPEVRAREKAANPGSHLRGRRYHHNWIHSIKVDIHSCPVRNLLPVQVLYCNEPSSDSDSYSESSWQKQIRETIYIYIYIYISFFYKQRHKRQSRDDQHVKTVCYRYIKGQDVSFLFCLFVFFSFLLYEWTNLQVSTLQPCKLSSQDIAIQKTYGFYMSQLARTPSVVWNTEPWKGTKDLLNGFTYIK